MPLHMCWPVKDPLQFTKCMKFVQLNKSFFFDNAFVELLVVLTEGERSSKNSNGKRAFFLFANTFNPSHFYHNKKCFLCLLKRILSSVCGLIFNSLNYSWFYQEQDYNWKKRNTMLYCHLYML